MTPHKIVGTGAYARARDNKGGTPMQLRLLVGMVGLGLVVTTALSAFAASQHVAEAIKHAMRRLCSMPSPSTCPLLAKKQVLGYPDSTKVGQARRLTGEGQCRAQNRGTRAGSGRGARHGAQSAHRLLHREDQGPQIAPVLHDHLYCELLWAARRP